MKLSAVILAAGSGSRMGHRPKGLLELDQKSLIERLIESILSVGIEDIVVVLGHFSDDFKRVLENQPVRLVLNPEPDRGQVSSQRLGLEHTSPRANGILMALADQPLITSPDLLELINAYQRKESHVLLVHPLVQGIPGNPVMLTQAARQSILESESDTGPRQWRKNHPKAVLGFETTNRHFITDVDTQADLEKLQSENEMTLLWPHSVPKS